MLLWEEVPQGPGCRLRFSCVPVALVVPFTAWPRTNADGRALQQQRLAEPQVLTREDSFEIIAAQDLSQTSERCYEGYLCLCGCCLNHIGSGPFKSRNNWPHTHEILHSFHRACGPLTLQCIPKLRFASDTLRSSVAAKHSRPF